MSICKRSSLKASKFRLQSRFRYLLLLMPLMIIGALFPMLGEYDTNRQGNIASGGWAAVQGNWAYFTDYDGLYKMDSRNGSVKKLAEGHFDQLNVVGDWIYYKDFINRKICKIRTNGRSNKVLAVLDKECLDMMVIDDCIYYMDVDEKLFMMSTSGGSRRQIAGNAMVIGADGSRLIAAVYDREVTDAPPIIYSMAKDGSNKKRLFEIENTSLFRGIYIQDGIFYYTTFKDGIASLIKYDMYKGKTSTIFEKKATFCKLNDGWFYYESRASEMFKASLDGSSEKKIASYLTNESVPIGDWILEKDLSEVYRSKENDSKKELINTKKAVEK